MDLDTYDDLKRELLAVVAEADELPQVHIGILPAY